MRPGQTSRLSSLCLLPHLTSYPPRKLSHPQPPLTLPQSNKGPEELCWDGKHGKMVSFLLAYQIHSQLEGFRGKNETGLSLMLLSSKPFAALKKGEF